MNQFWEKDACDEILHEWYINITWIIHICLQLQYFWSETGYFV